MRREQVRRTGDSGPRLGFIKDKDYEVCVCTRILTWDKTSVFNSERTSLKKII